MKKGIKYPKENKEERATISKTKKSKPKKKKTKKCKTSSKEKENKSVIKKNPRHKKTPEITNLNIQNIDEEDLSNKNENKVTSKRQKNIKTKKPNAKVDNKQKSIPIQSNDIDKGITEEEKEIITKIIIEELENEKKLYLKDSLEEIPYKLEEKKHIKSKYTTIEVEENYDNNINEAEDNNNKSSPILEVKNKKFNEPFKVPKNILYDGKIFYEDRHQSSNYPNIINYRCKNYRKQERNRNSSYCNAILKKKNDKNIIYFVLEKEHSQDCTKELEISKKIDTNLIGNYNDYLNKCFKYLDSSEEYNKTEFRIALQNIYNDNKYNFRLKENTIKNIIGRWKSNSLRFTKYNAIENKYNKNNELVLWEYNNCAIYTSHKKYPISSEYFIWSTGQIIARARMTKHLFIDATFHHPIGYEQLLIIIYKDIITADYIPGFYILMSNKTEILYTMVFKSVLNILTQNNIYKLDIKTITTDTELALINSIQNTFDNIQRLGCWFHLKQDLIREARTMGLLNKKNKNINIETTLEIITQLAILPIEYKGDINYLKNKVNAITLQYPKYYNIIHQYFMDSKLKYFEDGSYNYNSFPKDIRSNSILERYNKFIKNELGEKRTCNWVVFLNFINKELNRINDILSKNENKNILYESKHTKFGINKFSTAISEQSNIGRDNKSNNINLELKLDISQKWLVQKANNCRYNAYITFFYFTISPFLYNLKDNKLEKLNQLNELILKLADDVSEQNYYNIIIFLQKNKFDTNNKKIDEIINEVDEIKKENLIKLLKIDDTIDLSSSGYAAQLFSIFNKNSLFCIKESKSTECVICGKKNLENINEMQPFTFINSNNINNTSIFNIFLNKYKEIYSYACECRKNVPKNEDVLCLKIKYNIISYPQFLFFIFDFQYSELINNKDQIFKLIEDYLVLNINAEYKLSGIIAAPSHNHYNTIIFNPIGLTINSRFTPDKIYYHDGLYNQGNIVQINENMDWKKIGIPYIVLYKKII